MGTNQLVGSKKEKIMAGLREIEKHGGKARLPELWDGKSSLRIEKILTDKLG
jgi:hypothetical protein